MCGRGLRAVKIFYPVITISRPTLNDTRMCHLSRVTRRGELITLQPGQNLVMALTNWATAPVASLVLRQSQPPVSCAGPEGQSPQSQCPRTARSPCASLSMPAYYRTSRSLHFPGPLAGGSMLPFWIPAGDSVCQLEPRPPAHRTAFRLFVASPQSASFVVSQAEAEGGGPGPRAAGPVHSGHTAQQNWPQLPSGHW